MRKIRVSDGKLNTTGKRIAQLRQERNLSQNELAALLQLRGWNVHKNGISKIELGGRTTSEIELALLADALQVPLTDLIQDVMEHGVKLLL